MGLELKSPLVVSASPLTENVAHIKQMEDAGAAAVVLHSLFQEQIIHDQKEILYHSIVGNYISPEATSFFPTNDEYRLGPDEYMNLIRKAKETVKIPIIASLNGANIGGWTEYAEKMQEAGADALELNVYYIPTKLDVHGEEIEKNYLEIIKAVKSVANIPVAVKLSPFFSNIANMARKLDDVGANALVLFNRFYQPDIDLEELKVVPHLLLSEPYEMRLPMRWISILKGRILADLAATSGIHTGQDVIKMVMAGANVTMLCSVLLKHGIDYLKTIEADMVKWMTEKEYVSIKQMQGSLSQIKNSDPAAYERAQYMKALSSYKI
jgi:dihydroorotate dehydrogenase (fumarate)